MIARDRPSRSAKARKGEPPSFELRRFAWGAPDRLELAGVFAGLDAPPGAPPVLVLSGADRTHRLPAATDDVSGVPENGRPWHAAFVWQEAPAAFQAATLELGPKLAVDLPEPGDDGAAPAMLELTLRPGAREAPAGGAGGRLRLEADLLAAREELQEATAAAHRAEAELSRARGDLESEREGRAADSARFRDGIAQMRASAEEALAAEQDTSRRLAEDLKAALDAAGAREEELRLELDTAEAVWAESRSAADAEVEALQERVEVLTATAGEGDRLRTELAAATGESDRLRTELAAVVGESDRLHADLAAARGEAGTARHEIDSALEALARARTSAGRLAASDEPPGE